jgi:ribosome biogenesis GTPase / thiamine phosphate phosphatase
MAARPGGFFVVPPPRPAARAFASLPACPSPKLTMIPSELGWDDFFSRSFAFHSTRGLIPARVALESKHRYVVLSEFGEHRAECTGSLLHAATTREALPAVGDWVAILPRRGELAADIHAVLPRKTKFSRRTAGDRADEQILAANIDTVFLVTGLDRNFNLRRIERYLTAAWESGAEPVVLLNKADLHGDPDAARAEVEAVAAGAPVAALSAATGDGFPALQPWLLPGRTVALLGSSGAGKSTLINRILGIDRQVTAALSDAVGKGRHTTTRRELILTPSGVLVIDTPGMRELQLWAPDEAAVNATFTDITQLAACCRFSDCSHRAEPGCAVQAALQEGSLDFARWQSYQKLQRELAYAARRHDPRLARASKEAWKKLHRAHRAGDRFKNGKYDSAS